MTPSIRILHLEDSADDAALVHRALRTAGADFAATVVSSRGAFVAALEVGGFDLILSDFALPGFDGLSALALVRARWPELPVILVSGTLGEERAIDALKSGATDYVLKERLIRLGPAVRRAMQDAAERGARHRLEAQFIEAQKMEVIGQLAGGVAHDFNNLLAVIMGYCDLLTTEMGAEHPWQKYTQEIRHASERSVGLTRQLLVFSRKDEVQPVVLDLNVVIQELEKMLRRLIDENIELSLALGSDLGHVEADSGYVGQVVMNLVVNARDAMPHGGQLAIATRNVTVESGDPEHAHVPAGQYAMLSVSDTGTGMTEEVQARLFEAFFTTKPSGKGTGLGLVTCRSIVQQSGGHITVRSAPGQGTSFYVYFPRVAQALEIPPGAIPPTRLPGGTETLLVVEDEPSLRQLAGAVLEAQGYTVLSAANGQEGLRAAREHRGPPIRLVITDVVMPLMGGKVMVEWLKTSYPDLKVLFTSGYTEDAILEGGVLASGIEFLPKPYTPATLARKVRALLDAGTEPWETVPHGTPREHLAATP